MQNETKREHTKRVDRYHERESQIRERKTNNVCLDCKKTAKLSRDINHKKCPHCGSANFYEVGPMTRAPRKNASKRKWIDFAENFCRWKNSELGD
jgi:DNA-directed RNA polymerase subunit RPC12/RpoP